MSGRVWLPVLLGLSPLVAQAADATGSACRVWQRDLSFARSVQQHDATTFAAHLGADAIFNADTARPTRGRAAITKSWGAFLSGRAIRIDWYPVQIVLSADGKLAYSSGRYLFEDRAPKANPRYTIGAYATVWRRGSDGVWRVAFDGGDDGKPASDADASAFLAGRQLKCPRGL